MDTSQPEITNFTNDFSESGPYGVISPEVFIIVGIVFVVFGLIGSLILLIICSLDQTLRRSSKHFLLSIITILCILEQFLGAFIVHTHIDKVDIITVYGCEVSYFISAASYMSVSIVLMLVAAVAFDTVLTLCLKPSTAPPIRICIIIELVVVIVIGTALILLPLMNVQDYNMTCIVYMERHYMLAVNVIHFVPQVLILVLSNMVLLMCFLRKKGKRPGDDTPLPFPTDIFVASALIVILKFPDFIFSFGFNVCLPGDGSCRGMYIFWAVATYMSTGIYVLLPFVWLLGRDTRQGASRVLAYCCGRQYRQDMYILTCPDPAAV